ncbi:MAG TPA: homoserine O-acetyltransferase [Candidatus Limnocylindrales bacterium]|nr:homoserine O-acetyltransferase [Candidatus Limnocylindrales bacterium]
MHDGDPDSNGHEPHIREQARSVGIVAPQFAHFDEPLPLRSGAVLPGFTLAYETYGTLDTERSNAILICHALSGDAHVAGYHSDDAAERPGWWDEAVGPGKMFDTRRFYVICSNVLGGCRGSTGPSSLAPDGRPWGLRFPAVTVADMVRAQARLLDHLGITQLFAAAGGSMGGMQALEWAVQSPARVAHVLFIASTPRSSAQNIAFNAIGRAAIVNDPAWNRGEYTSETAPDGGLAVARMVGHITYMSDHSLETKFGRRLQGHEAIPYRFDEPEFAVESYLDYQGEKFVQRFDANSYLYITKALDYFDIAEGYESMESALAQTEASFLVVSFSSDWLYTEAQARELTQALRAAGRPVEERRVQALYGHDSFLVEVETMTAIVGGYLNRQWEAGQANVIVKKLAS